MPEEVNNLSEHIDYLHELGPVKKPCQEVRAEVQDWIRINISAGVAGAVESEERSLILQADKLVTDAVKVENDFKGVTGVRTLASALKEVRCTTYFTRSDTPRGLPQNRTWRTQTDEKANVIRWNLCIE